MPVLDPAGREHNAGESDKIYPVERSALPSFLLLTAGEFKGD